MAINCSQFSQHLILTQFSIKKTQSCCSELNRSNHNNTFYNFSPNFTHSDLVCNSKPSACNWRRGSLFSRKAAISNSKALRHKCASTICQLNDDTTIVYNGRFGPWKVETSDKIEVLAYRSALVTCATCFVLSASTVYLPLDNPLRTYLVSNLDQLYLIGSSSLGLALLLIHIYVDPLKKFLQFLWLSGFVASAFLETNSSSPIDQNLVYFVYENPYTIWLVGPLFASLTGLVFKEGLCYGKLEAAILFFIIPSLLLGHLSGITNGDVEKVLLAAWMGLFTLFASRKFTQPIKDDIGDKSVFIFQALSPSEQEALLKSLQNQQNNL